MDNQLKNISTQYRKFSKGQYVEHTQFNEFLDFFEDQDRLSRVMLQGVGIVCGFEPKFIKNNKFTALQLSQGIAITTDGDLLTLNSKSSTKNTENDSYMSELKNIGLTSKQYTHYKAYDNSKVKYPVFYKDPENQIELWELATEREAKKDFEPLTKFKNFEDKYLLLYLEAYEKEVKPCIGVDCDNHGVQRVQNLKVLVTTEEGIKQIIENDKVCPHPLSLNLTGEEKLKRVILKPEEQSADGIKQLFKEVTAISNYQSIFTNIDRICEIMGIPLYDHSDFIAELEALADKPENFQYAYGALKDITHTYSEIVKQLSRSFTKYVPDLASFPKHIMLGKITSQTKYDNSRHLFYNSPVLDNEKMDYERLRLLVYRFSVLNYTFKDPAQIAEQEGIKITPSKNISPLGNKAIPFYYDIHESLLHTWNFDKTVNRASNTNLSYATAMLSPDDHIQFPLDYDKGGKLFYRIEGHQGVDYATALSHIREIKDEQQLGFDVMALSLTQLKGNKDLSKAYYTDYVEKHPGLEHMGGVKNGGTFVVVYQSEEDRTVIADFALPYICCTPKSDVGLTLPVSTICEGESRLIFSVTPANGVVKANVKAGLTGGVELVNGQYMFNPQLVEDGLLGTEIGFTVNGKQTNCTIRVSPLPVVNIIASDFVYPEEGSKITTVTFNVSGENFVNYDYKWDFLDNGRYIALQPDALGDVKYQYNNIDETKPVKVSVDSKGCTEVKILKDWYKPQLEEVGLTLPANTICEDDSSLTFNVTPANGVVNGNGVELVNGQYMFNPQLVEDSLLNTQIGFTVNGKPTNCSITVLSLPVVNIVARDFEYPDADSTITTVTFNVSGENYTNYNYKWDFLGDGRYISLQPNAVGDVKHEYSEIDETKPVKVEVDSNGCTEVKTLNDWYVPQQVGLTLEPNVSTVCENASSLTFNVTPANGVVKANVSTDLTGGVEIVNELYMFNPQRVESSLLNTQIGFTVNGKPTNCSITVLPLPDVNIVARDFVYPDGDSTTTTVTFNVSGINFDKYDYKWDFLGDGKYVSLKPDAVGDVRYQYSEIDETKPIKVLVEDNGCTETKTLTDWYVPKDETNNLIVKIIPSRQSWAWAEGGDNIVLFTSEVTGASSTPTYQWSCTDAKVNIIKVDSPTPNIQFPSVGQFTITLDVTDGEYSGSETILYNVTLAS